MDEIPSRGEASKQWKRDGRWDEVARYMDLRRLEWKRLGVSRNEAVERAWLDAFREYPLVRPDIRPKAEELRTPRPPGAADLPAETVEALAKLAEAGSSDVLADVQWVYQHLGNPAMTAENSPSLGAWHLLQFARQFQQVFYEKLLPKALSKPATEVDRMRIDNGERHFQVIERLKTHMAKLAASAA